MSTKSSILYFNNAMGEEFCHAFIDYQDEPEHGEDLPVHFQVHVISQATPVRGFDPDRKTFFAELVIPAETWRKIEAEIVARNKKA